MLSTVDLERLIAVKRLEIEKEKSLLGLSSPEKTSIKDGQPTVPASPVKGNTKRTVTFPPREELNYNAPGAEKKERRDEDQDEIPADLDRYIRRYLGLPVMLKAGEYSPNNPLLREERAPGDALLGLGEYERRRNTLRRLRQSQYREYLDQQAKKKQEAKEQAERERREQERREREHEEKEEERQQKEREKDRELEGRERERRIEQERRSPERRRASVNTVNYGGGLFYSNKVDTGVQVDCRTAPLSVAVQTDDAELFRLPSPSKSQLTRAERELSPHTVRAPAARERPAPRCAPAPRERPAGPHGAAEDTWKEKQERRRSYGDSDERTSALVRKSNRDKLSPGPRPSRMPPIFDADAIQLRNVQAEKEASARRQFYQQELKNQIAEQRRIREERENREKLLEAAESRRLEEQLRAIRGAKDDEIDRQKQISIAIRDENLEYHKKRKELQKDIDAEQMHLKRAPHTSIPKRLPTPRSDTDTNTKLPYYYPLLHEKKEPFYLQERKESFFQDRSKDYPRLHEKIKDVERKPYSMNIPDDSIFSPNYDVDSYLRKNLNFKDRFQLNKDYDLESEKEVEENIEKVLVHERPKVKPLERFKPIPKERKIPQQESMDSLPIPVLRHSPLSPVDRVESGSDLSDAMRKVDDKWKVPIVQKNILKSVPNDEGKNVNILTQLGSIRRQLQLEQLKLDRLSNDEV